MVLEFILAECLGMAKHVWRPILKSYPFKIGVEVIGLELCLLWVWLIGTLSGSKALYFLSALG